jgi:hypothetical protein
MTSPNIIGLLAHAPVLNSYAVLPKTTTIIYDGLCPVCNNLAALAKLKIYGDVLLINVRNSLDVRQECKSIGVDLNETFIVIQNGNIFFQGEALALLAQSSNSAVLGAFRSKKLSVLLYPTLVVGRRLLLKILRRPKI